MCTLVLTDTRLIIGVAGVRGGITGRAPGDLLLLVPANETEQELCVVFADPSCESGLDGSRALGFQLEEREHCPVDTAALVLAFRVGLLKLTWLDETPAADPDSEIVVDLIRQRAHHGQRLSKMFRNEGGCR